MRTARFILLLSTFLCVHFNIASGTTIPIIELKSSHPIGNGTHIDSFDFHIENVEHEDVFLGSVSTLRKHDNGSFPTLSNGGQLIYTHNSIHVNVTSGYVALSFSGDGGQIVTFASGAGNYFEFEPESFTIEASAKNVKDVVVHLDGVNYFIPPGKRSQIVEIEIITKTNSHDFMTGTHENTALVIFGSAHLDVGNIEIESLFIENLTVKAIGRTDDISTIVHADDDDYPDLVVMFEDITRFVKKNINQATISGYLTDGTIINGKI